MRSLIILKGLVKQKKLGWVKREHLQNFLLDINDARNLFYRPEYKGQREYMTRSFDDLVYRVFIKSLCTHLATGCLVVVDMDNESTSTVEELATIFGYTIFYHVESTPFDYIGKNKKYCDPRYLVPTKETLKKQVDEFKRQAPGWTLRIETYEDVETYWKPKTRTIALKPEDSVLHISDVHSHWTMLNDLVPAPEDFALTVFVGDYIDGPENGGSRKLMDQILNYEGNNIIFLEGNHELRLRKFLGYIYFRGKGKKIVSEELWEEISDEFLEKTAQEFSDIHSQDAWDMILRINEVLREFVIYDRGDCSYICTHCGLRWLEQLSPKYIGNVIYSNKNSDRVDEAFSRICAYQNIYSFHGHCAYPSGFEFQKYMNIVNFDTEDEYNLNYFINKPNNEFEICVLRDE